MLRKIIQVDALRQEDPFKVFFPYRSEILLPQHAVELKETQRIVFVH